VAKLFGDWAKAAAALEGGSARLARAIERAVLKEAQGLRKEIVLQLRSQEGFKPLSPWTIAKRKLLNRGGTKALIQRGDLIGGINVVKAGSDMVFVGIPRSAQDRDGRELVRIGAVHEYGTDPTIIPITPRMRRFLAAVASKLEDNKSFEGEFVPKLRGGKGASAVVVQIPARPFLRPAFDRWRVGAQRRLYAGIAKNMGWA